MYDFYRMYLKINELSVDVLKRIFDKHHMSIENDHLMTALDVIKNNPYSFVNKRYTPILLAKIKDLTNENVSQCFQSIINTGVFWEEIL